MSNDFYLRNPDLKDYFISMPEELRRKLVENEIYISSLGELQKWADYYSEK